MMARISLLKENGKKMKICEDFITNSSSSSFIIRAKDVDLLTLFHGAFKEFYNSVYDCYTAEENDENFKLEKIINNNDNACSIHIVNKAYLEKDDYGPYYQPETKKITAENDELFYLITNNDCIRFDFQEVDDIFDVKYKIPYEKYYCD